MNDQNNSFDPQLNNSEEVDQATLQKLQQMKPSVKPDAKFASMLREEIADRSKALSVSFDKSTKQPLTLFSFMTKLIIPLVAIAVVAGGTGYWFASQDGGKLIGSENILLSDEISVSELAENSFGDLDKVQIVADNGRGAGSGGGNETATMAAEGDAEKVAAPADGTDMSILPYPTDTTNVKYEYVGEDISNLPADHGVLKREKPEQSTGLVARIIRFFSFGLIDLTKMQDAKMQSISFMEDKEYGLGVNVDLAYGSVNIYQNWEKWPQPDYGCYSYNCVPNQGIKIEDYPSDQEAISIADQFIQDYAISREGYGPGEIIDYSDWRIQYEQTADKASFWFPEQVTVIYPLQLNGQTVYDEGGNPSGMQVMIDVRTKKVSGMWGLETKQYEKSKYVGEESVKRIMEIALRGGYRNYGYDWIDGGGTVQLGTPKMALVRMYYTDDIRKPGEELYVPALIFPVTNKTGKYFYRKNVMVPLVKDILDNENIYNQPIPLEEPAAPVEDPIPVEPDGGIGDTPVETPISTQSEPAVLPEAVPAQ